MDIVITHGVRTPIAKFGASLKDYDIKYLGKLIIDEIVNNRAQINKEEIDHIIFGNVKQSANPANMARYISLAAKLPEDIPAYTVHRQCGSGLQAIMDAYLMIKCKQANVVLAGGVENMSQSPYFMRNTKNGLGSTGKYVIEDSLIAGGPGSIPKEMYGSIPMGVTAENVADRYNISRLQQDQFAQTSQERMANAIKEGYFEEQIVPVTLSNGKVFSIDEHPFLSNVEKLGKLTPVFKKDGSVTAGNSSGRNDGAASVLVMNDSKAQELGYEPIVKILAIASSGCEPDVMGLAPVECTKKALERANITMADLDVIELNEAFAAQSIGVIKEYEKFGVSYDDLMKKINPNGGAIAMGHPLGCTGSALMVKCMAELQRVESNRYGLVTLCCAGGVGVAVIVEKYQKGDK